jgi:CheY-like chemotaxis protein
VEQQSLYGVAVLLVEDSFDMRFLLTRILKRLGAEVWAVSSADEALAFLSEKRADVIVSDITMPDMDGYELMRRVREDIERESEHKTPAVALSGHADPASCRRSLAAGFQVHLTKPVNNDHLAAVVGRLAELDGEAAKDGYGTVDLPPPPPDRQV